VDEFARDLQQVIAGLLEASVNHSTVHRTAVKMKDQVYRVNYKWLLVMWMFLCIKVTSLSKNSVVCSNMQPSQTFYCTRHSCKSYCVKDDRDSSCL